MNQAYQTIYEQLDSSRKRRVLISRTRTALIAAALIAAALLAAGLLIPALEGWPRYAIRMAALAAIVFSAVSGLFVALTRKEDLDRTARAVERKNPGTKNQLSLFDREEYASQKRKNLNVALDSLYEKHGDSSILPGSLLTK